MMIFSGRIKIKKIGWTSTIFNSIQYCVYILGIFLIIWILWKIGSIIGTDNWPPTIEKISNWSQIIIAYAAIFAVGQYAVSYADISDKKTKTVLEFVKFFRENVIESADNIRCSLKDKKIQLPTILLRKNTPFFKFTIEEFFQKIYVYQKSSIEDYISLTKDDLKLENMIRSCLNSTEEFAIGILNSNSQDHKAVVSIKKPFIEIVEQFAVPLYFCIGITNDGFPYLSKLYKYWKNDVGYVPIGESDRLDTFEERAKKYRNNKLNAK